MIIFFQELILQLFLWLLRLIDGTMELFSAISGVTKVNYQGQEVNLLEFILGDSTVGTIFWCIFILAIGLTCIFTIVSLVKNMLSGARSVSGIVGKFGLSLLGTMAMLAVVVLGILISGALLQLVAEIFQIGTTEKLSNALFNACVEDWLNGYSVTEIDVADLSVREIFGDYNTVMFGIWPTGWKCNGMVDPNTFLYLPAMIASIALGIALLLAIVNLAKRVYELAILYLIMPVSLSTLSLDDGARFKVWRETFITKIVLAYGAVFSVNVFALILPLITQMQIPGIGGFGNAMFLIIMIVGGAMVIPGGQALFARLFGSGEDMHPGGGFLHSAFYGGRIAGMLTLGMAAKIIGGGLRVGGKMIASGRNRKHLSDGSDDSDRYSDEKTQSGETTAENGGEK